jgi:hypothetical protein
VQVFTIWIPVHDCVFETFKKTPLCTMHDARSGLLTTMLKVALDE